MRRFGMAKIYMLSWRPPLSAVLSISSEMVLQLDNNLRITLVNQPFLDLIGTDEKELVGKNIEYTSVALFFDDLFSGFAENIRKGIEGRELSGEIVLPIKDIILSCRIAPTVFDDGRKGVSVIFEDITERKKAETELQESQDRYRTLVEISPDAVFLHQEGKIIYANPAAMRILGASQPGEIIGKNILDFISPTFRDTVRTNIQKDLNGQVSPRTELHMMRFDGTPIIIEGRGVGTIISGKPTVQVAIRDITEQKRAQDALQLKERQLFSFFSNVPERLFYLSIERGNRFRFLTVNQAFLDALHMSSDQVVGKYVHDVIQEPLFSRARRKYMQAVAEKKTVQWEEVVEYPTGKRYGDCNITAIFDENGQPANIIGSIHDGTGYRRIEDALRESENLYRTLAESSTDLIFVIGRDDRVEYVNSYVSAMVNKPVDQIIGGPRASLFPPDVARNQKEALEKVFETGAPLRNESPITFAGRVYWFDHYLTPLKDADNNIRSVLGISRDITERKNTEKKLRENEQSYQRLLEQSFDAIAIHKDRKIGLCRNAKFTEVKI